MNGENQVEQDKERQEAWRQEYNESFLRDRANQNMIRGRTGTNAATIGKEAAKLANKETFNKFEKALGKGAGKIKAQRHSMAGWTLGIVLAIAKDLLDMSTVETISWIDWIIDIILGIGLFLLFGKSVKTGTKLIRALGPTIMEAIPVLGFLPVWTFSVVYLYFKSQQENQ